MSLNNYEISLFTKEFKDLLPLKIEKLYIPEENILVLTVYKSGFKKHLLIEVGSNYSGLYFVKERPIQNLVANIQNRFRNTLVNGLLKDISQINNDRILELIIDRSGTEYKLILELTGRHGNVFILNENIIESVLLLNKRDRKRELGLNSLYQYPFVGDGRRAIPENDLDNAIPENDLDNAIPENDLDNAIPENDSHDVGRHGDLPVQHGFDSFLEYLEEKYSKKIIEEKKRLVENSYERAINKKKKKLKNKKKKLILDLEKLNSYKGNKNIGELIKANLYQMKRGMKSISVVDYYDKNMKEVDIKLDESKAPIENMEFYFKKYEKYKRGVVFIEKELKKVEKEIAKLESSQVVTLTRGHVPLPLKNKQKQQETHTPYKTYISNKGFKILVGKRSTDNDYLTFKVASGNDIWLHVISYPGSHVIIKKNNKKDVIDINSIYEAAHLAILNSKAPNNDSVEVCYTFRKFVKKPPKSKPGAVIYTMEKRLYLQLDKNIIEKLKED